MLATCRAKFTTRLVNVTNCLATIQNLIEFQFDGQSFSSVMYLTSLWSVDSLVHELQTLPNT